MAVTAVYAKISHIRRNDGKATLDAPVSFSNISATTAAFTLSGGKYCVDVVGSTFGNVSLQKLAVDGTTYVSVKDHYRAQAGDTSVELAVSGFASNGAYVLDLPFGTYRLTLA